CIDFVHPETFRQNGFSDRMLRALSKRRGDNSLDQYEFRTRDVLPVLGEPHEPALILLTSFHAHGQIFGYLASAYQKPEDIEPDAYYTSWCDAAAHGLYQLQQEMFAEFRHAQMAVLSTHDPETGLYNRRGLAEHLHDLLRRCPHPLLVLMRVSSLHTGNFDPALLFANAMRDTLPESALYARMQQQIFAILLPVSEDADAGEAAETVRFQIDQRIQHLLGVSAQQPPMIQVHRQQLQYETLAETAQAIEQAEQTLSDSAAADAGYYPDYKEQLLRLRSEIQANPQKDWNIAAISKELGISRSHLQRLYKQQFAASCMDDIIMVRVRKAQQLLQFTSLRIQEIAVQCGYNNESHFMRQFKEKCNMTALQYRNTHK
ncbi:MAG: AraC family transcriptional regulator, partial [Oscillospiraceae bacterium]|nr:AraC family transcriptional regulator [Oscillospiraceae bacterium]